MRRRNQDLAGIFYSIAKPQFVQAWRVALEFYRQRHGIQPDTIFTIDLKERAQQLRIFRGRRRGGATRQVRIWTEYAPHHYICTPLLCNLARWRDAASDRPTDLPWDLPCHPHCAAWLSQHKKKLGAALSALHAQA